MSVVCDGSMSQSSSTMFTMQQLDNFITKPKHILKFLRDRALILPLRTTCPHSSHNNQHIMEITHNERTLDGLSYRCYKCNTTFSLRHRSIFYHSSQNLLMCCRMLVCFDLQLTVTQTSTLLGLSRDIVSDFYYHIRVFLFNWNLAHFKMFTSNEIVECDELFMKHLIAVGPDEEDLPAHWICGIVSRTTGRVYLQIIADRESATFKNFFTQHIERGACVITDGWSYGSWLSRDYRHYVCKKVPVQGHTIEEPYEVADAKFGKIIVHTNSIEGFWSEFRAERLR